MYMLSAVRAYFLACLSASLSSCLFQSCCVLPSWGFARAVLVWLASRRWRRSTSSCPLASVQPVPFHILSVLGVRWCSCPSTSWSCSSSGPASLSSPRPPARGLCVGLRAPSAGHALQHRPVAVRPPHLLAARLASLCARPGLTRIARYLGVALVHALGRCARTSSPHPGPLVSLVVWV